MSKYVFTSLSPNLEEDDFNLAKKLIKNLFRWKNGPAILELEKTFAEYLGSKNATSFESGRTSLYTILKALNIQAGDEVLLQAYTCVAVPEPILWLSARPIYVDCEDERLTMDSKDLERKITKKSKVLIIQHTFGNPAKLKQLLAIAKKHKLFVIEDCAHALGTTYAGKKVGLFGDAGFFSFGRDKVISSVFGGMVVAKTPELAQKIKNLQEGYPFPKTIWIKRQLLHPIITWKGKQNYAKSGKLLLKINKLLKITSRAVYPIERRGGKPSFIGHKLPNALANLALHQLQKLDRFNAHRQEITKIYNELLKGNKNILRQKEIAGSIYLRYTIKVKNRDQILDRAKSKGLFLGDWYTSPIAPKGVSYTDIGYNRHCRLAEKNSQLSLNLPTDINTSPEDAKRIVEFILNETNQGQLAKITSDISWKL